MTFANSKNAIILSLTISLWIVCGYYMIRLIQKSKRDSETITAWNNTKNFTSFSAQTRLALQGILLVAVTFLATLMALRPTGGQEFSSGFNSDLDIVLLIDNSLSMTAQDYLPNSDTSRLEGMKLLLTDFLHRRTDRFAIFTFSHRSNIECPLTFDKQTQITGVNSIGTVKSYRAYGTSLSTALTEVYERLENSEDLLSEGRQKIILLLSDGEEVGDSTDKYHEPLTRLTDAGYKLLTIGLGSTQGAKVVDQIYNTGEVSYLRLHGEYAISTLDDEKLRQLANEGDGEYIHSSEFDKLEASLENISRNSTENNENIIYKDYYFYLAPLVGILLLLLYLEAYKPVRVLHSRNKSTTLNALNPILLLLLYPVWIVVFQILLFLGVQNYQDANYLPAANSFIKASDLGVDRQGISFNNTGNAYYKNENYEESINSYLAAIELAEQNNSTDNLAQYHYNLANSYFKQGMSVYDTDIKQTVVLWLKAINDYEESLRYDPDDTQAKENLEFVLSLFRSGPSNKLENRKRMTRMGKSKRPNPCPRRR